MAGPLPLPSAAGGTELRWRGTVYPPALWPGPLVDWARRRYVWHDMYACTSWERMMKENFQLLLAGGMEGLLPSAFFRGGSLKRGCGL